MHLPSNRLNLEKIASWQLHCTNTGSTLEKNGKLATPLLERQWHSYFWTTGINFLETSLAKFPSNFRASPKSSIMHLTIIRSTPLLEKK